MPRRDEDDDDDRPRRRRRDDEEDDRPRREKKARGQGGPSWVLFAGIGGGLLAIVVVVMVVIVVMKGRKDGGGNDTTAGGGSGATGGSGGGSGGPAPPAPPGEMGGVIGEVDGMKPPIVKPSADAPGVAFRLPIHEGYEAYQIVLPAQPSDFLTLVFVNRERFVEPMATAVDRRTARPVGKKFLLLPEFARIPRPPLNLTPPDLSPDGTLLSTHKNSWVEKTDNQPLQVWDVASGKLVKEIVVPPGTIWQGWVSPDRLLSVGKAAHLDSWAYPGGTRTEGSSAGIKGPINTFSPLLTPGGTLGRSGGTPRFAVSADHKKVALPRVERKCYAVLDVTTGRELGQTAEIGAEWLDSIAFSPDGSRLAYLAPYPDKSGSRVLALVVADGTKGTGGAPVRVPDPVFVRPDGMNLFSWWGPDLLVYLAEGGVYNVFDLATGQVAAKLKYGNLADGGVLIPGPADGRLWVRFESRVHRLYTGAYICALEPTAEVRSAKGATFDLTPDGIRRAAK